MVIIYFMLGGIVGGMVFILWAINEILNTQRAILMFILDKEKKTDKLNIDLSKLR